MSSFETLDVGCGNNPRGDVNVDCFPNRRDQCVIGWDTKKVRNFVLADCEYLPFQDAVFKKIFAIHVLEHLKNPPQALKEWKRVGEIVVIRVPSAYDLDQTKTHIYTWNQATLTNLLDKIFENVRVFYTSKRIHFRGRLTKYIPFLRLLVNRFPAEIRAVCWS